MGDEQCPMASFKLYPAKLNPNCDAFFRRPLTQVEPGKPWFAAKASDITTMSSFVACMSDEARPSQRSIKAFYPSIRASCMPMDSEAGPLCLPLGNGMKAV